MCHLYVLHPPGGVVGGDSLQIDVSAQAGSAALLTAPGATKFYRSGGALARQRIDLRVAEGATVEWLPQENIVFPGARVASQMAVHLAPGARFIGWETHCLGRPAIKEAFTRGCFDTRWVLYRAGKPLLHERLKVAGAADLARVSGLRGWPVTATLWATGATDALLQRARAHLPTLTNASLGLTLLGDLLVARYLGASTAQVRGAFEGLWRLLRTELWGRVACPPRIWAT